MIDEKDHIVIDDIEIDTGGLANAFGTCNHVIRENAYHIPEKMSGWTVFDIGANIGSFSLMAAKRGARVFSFEPFPPNYKLLKKNISLNSLDDKITAFDVGVGNPKTSKLFFHPVRKDWCSVDPFLNDLEGENYVTVDIVSLKTAMKMAGVDHITFLKLDCEGSEISIFSELTSGLHTCVGDLAAEFHYGPEETDKQLAALSPFFTVTHSSSPYEHFLTHV